MKTQEQLAFLIGPAIIALIAATPVCADNLTFYPTDDAAPDQYSGHGYGHANESGVRNKYGNGPYWEQDSITRFDISSIPPGAEIVSATFNLYYFRWWDHNPQGRPVTCYRITSDWDEDTVTWATRPSWLPPGQWTDSTNIPASFSWMQWDVTTDVQLFVDRTAPNFGWALMDETYWGSGGIPFAFFRSKDYGQLTPFLEVVAIPAPATLTLVACGALLSHRRRRQ